MPDSIDQEKGNTRYEILLYKFTKYCYITVVNLIFKTGCDYYQYEVLPF